MKRILAANLFLLAVPGFAQEVPSTDPHANNVEHHASQGQEPCKHGTAETQRHCQDMMKDHAKAEKRAKKAAAKVDAEFNGNGHQGHNH